MKKPRLIRLIRMTLCLLAVIPFGGAQAQTGSLDPIPGGIPALAREYQMKAHNWHPDAALIRIEIRNSFPYPSQGQPPLYNTYSVVLIYYSAAANQFHEYWTGPGGRTHEKPGMRQRESTELKLNFVDLPQAVDAAKASGEIQELKAAVLHYIRTGESETQEAWQFLEPGGRDGRLKLVLAESGKALDIPDSCYHCETGPEVAARESESTGVGAMVPDGETDIEPIGWTWTRHVYTTQPVYGRGLDVPVWEQGKPSGPPIYHTDYYCYNVVRGAKGYYFLNGKGTGIPDDCALKQSHKTRISHNRNALAVGAWFTRRSSGAPYFVELGSEWKVEPYDKTKCSNLGIDVCP